MKHHVNILGLFSVKCDVSQCTFCDVRSLNWGIFELESFCLGNQPCVCVCELMLWSGLLQDNKK